MEESASYAGVGEKLYIYDRVAGIYVECDEVGRAKLYCKHTCPHCGKEFEVANDIA